MNEKSSTPIEEKKSFTPGSQPVKLPDGTAKKVYQCAVCNQVREASPGEKLAIYLKETVGHRDGFICPECDTGPT